MKNDALKGKCIELKNRDIKGIFDFTIKKVTFDFRNSIPNYYLVGLKNQKRMFKLQIYFVYLSISKLLFDISIISKFLSDNKLNFFTYRGN